MQTDIRILSKVFGMAYIIGLAAKYVESRYNIVDVVFALPLYKHL